MKILSFIKKHMATLVLVVAIIAFVFPQTFGWIKTSVINYLLGAIMLCMGLTLKLSDFKIVFSAPKNIIIGCIAQFSIMPLLAWLLTKIFQLPPDLAIGVILVGCCPGGTSSNVITYLAKGDLALSVGMTATSTLLAPLLTPLLCWLLADKIVEVDTIEMFLSIVKVVILPIAIGLYIQHFSQKKTQQISDALPACSSVVIAMIVGIVVSANSTQLHTVGLMIIAVVALHNVCGFLLGYFIGKLLKLSINQKTAISIEVGMQNSGLACSLAQQHFAALQSATVPGAIFSVWHNIAGSVAAKIFSRKSEK